jgi:hypothetical protein
MTAKIERIGVVGHYTWFSNHFPEHWDRDPNVLCLDVNEGDYNFLVMMKNFWPSITLFYRPELYPRRLLDAIPGAKVAMLSEPVPYFDGVTLQTSSETDLRLRVYSGMQWDAFDRVFYYDAGKASAVERLGWKVSGYHPLPIDTAHFRPSGKSRPIDICFIGKPTPRRIAEFDFLRSSRFRFVWIAHGVHGKELAQVLRRSKVVLNVHADDLPAMEPRLFLAASCGCCVLTERLPAEPSSFPERIIQYEGPLSLMHVQAALDRFEREGRAWNSGQATNPLGTRDFLNRVWRDLPAQRAAA